MNAAGTYFTDEATGPVFLFAPVSQGRVFLPPQGQPFTCDLNLMPSFVLWDLLSKLTLPIESPLSPPPLTSLIQTHTEDSQPQPNFDSTAPSLPSPPTVS